MKKGRAIKDASTQTSPPQSDLLQCASVKDSNRSSKRRNAVVTMTG
jgi:hypothetical protein